MVQSPKSHTIFWVIDRQRTENKQRLQRTQVTENQNAPCKALHLMYSINIIGEHMEPLLGLISGADKPLQSSAHLVPNLCYKNNNTRLGMQLYGKAEN